MLELRIYSNFRTWELILLKGVSFRTDYKYVICGNYVVLYKIGEEYVEIYRVVNRYQDITKIFL